LTNEEEDCDAEAEALFGKWAGRVHRYLTSMGCDPGLAEEITTDAFLVASRRCGHVKTLDRPEGYVFEVAKNMRRRRQPGHDARARDLQPDPATAAPRSACDDFTETIAERDAVLRALQQLPPRTREAVVLRHVVGLSVEETANIMKISKGAVKSITSKGRACLRDHFSGPSTGEEGRK
jgi:RNA polymerase sigma factor (sigma-70 family)